MTFFRIFMLASSKNGLGFFAVSCLLSAVGAPKGHCLLYPFADLRLLICMRVQNVPTVTMSDRKKFSLRTKTAMPVSFPTQNFPMQDTEYRQAGD